MPAVFSKNAPTCLVLLTLILIFYEDNILNRRLNNVSPPAIETLVHKYLYGELKTSLLTCATPLFRKHIITPVYNMPEGVPLALVAWGCRLEMTEVDPDKVMKFIRDRGLQGGLVNEVPFLN